MKALNVSVNVIGEMMALRKMSQVKGFQVKSKRVEAAVIGWTFDGTFRDAIRNQIPHFTLSVLAQFSSLLVNHFQPSRRCV